MKPVELGGARNNIHLRAETSGLSFSIVGRLNPQMLHHRSLDFELPSLNEVPHPIVINVGIRQDAAILLSATNLRGPTLRCRSGDVHDHLRQLTVKVAVGLARARVLDGQNGDQLQ